MDGTSFSFRFCILSYLQITCVIFLVFVKACLCPLLDSLSTFRIVWSAVIMSPNWLQNAFPLTRFVGLLSILPASILSPYTLSHFGSCGEWVNTLWHPLAREPKIPSLLLVSFARVSLPVSVTTEGLQEVLSSHFFWRHVSFGVEEDAKIQHSICHHCFSIKDAFVSRPFTRWERFVSGNNRGVTPSSREKE